MSRKRQMNPSPWKANDMAQAAKLLSDPLYDDAFVQAGNYMVYPRKQQVTNSRSLLHVFMLLFDSLFRNEIGNACKIICSQKIFCSQFICKLLRRSILC